MKLLEIFSIISEEQELLFELRNVVNVDELKSWSLQKSHIVAEPFGGTPVYNNVRAWAEKALIKWMLENAPGEPVKMDPTKRIADVGGNNFKRLEELPDWMQQALQRGDELTWLDMDALSSGTLGAFTRGNINRVKDWLRYKYQTEPRTFTRLNRIPWHEAMRMAEDYHKELERKRPRDVNEMLEWFRQNKDVFMAFLDEHLQNNQRIHEAMINTLNTPGDYTFKSMNDLLGPRLWGKLQQVFKKASGFSVEMPQDDPSGRQPYLRYDDKGAILAPEPEKEEDPTLRMDWGDEVDQDALEVEKEDFEPAPEFGPGWYKLNTTKCVEYEGTIMGHCVGGYGREVESGRIHIYSLRDAQNMPHVTIEVFPHEDGLMEIKQIKGRENKSPVDKYVPKVLDFIRNMRGEHDRVAWDDEAEADLLGMSMTVNDENEILMYDPPFEYDKFNAQGYERRYSEDEDDEESYEFDEPVDEPLEREGTSVENGTFGDVLTVIAEVLGYDSWYAGEGAKNIMDHFASGRGCWFSIDGPDDVIWVEVCYRGSDMGTGRELKRVL